MNTHTSPSEQKLGYCHPFPASQSYFNKQRNHLADTFLDHKTPNDGFGILCFYWSASNVYFLGQAWSAWKRGNGGGRGGWGGCRMRGRSCEAEMWSGACVALALTAVWQTHWHHRAEKTGGGGGGGGGRRRRQITGHPDAGKVCGAEAEGRNVIIPIGRFSGTSSPPKKRQQRGGMMLIPRSKSPLYPQPTHHHTSPVSLSSHRVMVKLALPLSVCHVVSLLLCNFLFFSAPLSPKECVSCRSTSQCQGAKQPMFGVWLSHGVPEVPEGFQEFQLVHPRLWRHLRECCVDQTRHFLDPPFIQQGHESLFHVRIRTL